MRGWEMPLRPLVTKAKPVGWEHHLKEDGTLRRWWGEAQPQTA